MVQPCLTTGLGRFSWDGKHLFLLASGQPKEWYGLSVKVLGPILVLATAGTNRVVIFYDSLNWRVVDVENASMLHVFSC